MTDDKELFKATAFLLTCHFFLQIKPEEFTVFEQNCKYSDQAAGRVDLSAAQTTAVDKNITGWPMRGSWTERSWSLVCTSEKNRERRAPTDNG